jgi:hypothetical protein
MKLMFPVYSATSLSITTLSLMGLIGTCKLQHYNTEHYNTQYKGVNVDTQYNDTQNDELNWGTRYNYSHCVDL